MSQHLDTGRIHILSPVLAGQIAAGEVIERPASVVKELLENSLDAGARHIRIDVEAAGSRLIRVRDDGCGIHPDDLPLAPAAHSTSKIRTAEDLARIASLGFRGEALASIAAIARLHICSRQANAGAYAIDTEPGAIPAVVAPASHPQGTGIEVRDLFFNVPARRKFLRTEQTEFLHILELVRSFSLSRPDIGLQLWHNGRQAFTVNAATGPLERVRAIFGRAFPARACRVEQAHEGVRITGVAGRPESARSQTDRQYVFLNGRLIRDRRLNHALRLAYAERLPPGRHAPFVLYLEMDPAEYDINVHPAKHEVRFRRMREVHDYLYSALRRALEDNQPVDDVSTPSGSTPRHARAAAGVNERSAPGYAAAMEDMSGSAVPDGGQFGRPLGLVCRQYLLTEAGDGCWLIDYRQAAGRLAAVNMRAALEKGPLPSRPLLVPEATSVPAAVIDWLEQAQDRLQYLGIRLEPTGPGTLALRELPAQLPVVDAADLLAGVRDWIQDAVTAGKTFDPDRLIELLAHKSVRMAPDTLHEPEQRRFLRELDEARKRGLIVAPWPWRRLDAADLAAFLNEQS